jgi:hypothetical protein
VDVGSVVSKSSPPGNVHAAVNRRPVSTSAWLGLTQPSQCGLGPERRAIGFMGSRGADAERTKPDRAHPEAHISSLSLSVAVSRSLSLTIYGVWRYLQAVQSGRWERPPDALPDASSWPTWGALRERILTSCKQVR